VPEAVGYRSQLEAPFRDPAMAAPMAAAPASLSRPLRSLCRMPGLRPPPILVVPARCKAASAAPRAPPPHPAPPRRPPRTAKQTVPAAAVAARRIRPERRGGRTP
jgi:hypothetical protein